MPYLRQQPRPQGRQLVNRLLSQTTELRAIGDVLCDQFFFMIRCGFSTLQPHEGTVSSSPGMAGRLTLSRALGLLKEAINLEDSCFVPARKSLLSGYLGVLHEATVIRLRRM